MTTQHAVFQDFRRGDFGRLIPSPNRQGGHFRNTFYPGGFRGLNTYLYPNGSIGPRPPFYTLAVTGLPSKQISHMIYNDAQAVMVVIFTTGAVWKFDPTTAGAATSVGTLAGTVPVAVVSSGTAIYGVRTAGNGLAKIELSTNTLTDYAAVTGNFITVYGFQWIIVNTSSATPNRLNYSALGDPSSWPGNFTDVGDTTAIAGIFVQRNSLSIPKVSGEWWVTSGVLGAETHRRVEKGLNFAAPGVLSLGQNLWWVNGRDIVAFSGAQIQATMRPDEPYYAVGAPSFELGIDDIAPLSASDDIVIVGTSYNSTGLTATQAYAQVRIGQAWTRHVLPVGSLTNAAGSNLLIRNIGQGKMLLAVRGRTGGAGDLAPTFYLWQPRDEFPNISQRNDGTSSAPVSSSFDLSEIWPEDGSQIKVTKVVVDFSFDYELATPEAGLVGFTVGAEALNVVNHDNGISSSTVSWIPQAETRATSIPTFKFVRARATFDFGDQGWGGGAVLHFTNVKSVVVYRVIMFYEIQPMVSAV